MSKTEFNSLDFFETIRTTEKFSEFKYKPNGLRVVLIPYESSTNTLSCTMNYHVGSYDERVGYTGSCHLLEHLLFKDPLKGSSKNIFQMLDKWGATINATTSESRTNFYAVIPQNVLNVWLQAEAARMQYVPFDVENRDKKEKLVVVDELRMGNDNPFKLLTENVVQVAFDRSGYNHMTGGFIEDVKQTTQKRLKHFWDTFYGPNNCSMVIVGNADPTYVLTKVHKHFKSIKPREVVRLDREEVKQNGPRQTFVYSKHPYTLVQVAFRAMEGMHPDSIVLDLVSELMQYPKIGILNVLKEANLIPMYNVNNNRNLHRHLFQITAGVGNPQAVKVLQIALWKWFAGISKQSIDNEVLMMAKQKLKNKWNNQIYSNGVESIGSAATEAISLGNVSDIFEREKLLELVTMGDINRVSSYIFQDARCTIGVLAPSPPNILERPSLQSANYENKLIPIHTEVKPSMSGVDNIVQMDLQNNSPNVKRYKSKFGLLQHIRNNSSQKRMYLISTKAVDSNISLGEIACKIITEGIDKSAEIHEAHNLIFSNNNSVNKSFNNFKIAKNLDFKIFSNKGRLNLVVSFDKEHDSNECLDRLSHAIKNIPSLTKNDILVKIKMVSGEWSGQAHDVNYITHQKITESMFTSDDTNYIVGASEKIQMVNAISKDQLENFVSHLFDKDRPFLVTALTDEEPQEIVKAVNTFYKRFIAEKNGFIPFDPIPSKPKEIKSNVTLIKDHREDGVVAMGIRVPLSKNDPEFSAIRLAMDVLGDGIYSRLNLPLRVEQGLSYGVYSRLRGGNHSSDSYVHIFGSFKYDKLMEAKEKMHEIYNNFVQDGITEQEFKEKKSHLLNSLKVRGDNPSNMFMMHHQTLLNGNLTVTTIKENIKSLTHEGVNEAIEKYLLEKPICTVIGGIREE